MLLTLNCCRRNPDAFSFLIRTASDTTTIQRQIATTDKAIDALVYELYGLTEEEIGAVEGKHQQ